MKFSKPQPDLSFELRHRAEGRCCVGVDEVGRGCLAGPVVTAAVVLPDFILDAPAVRSSKRQEIDDSSQWWRYINDSKLVQPKAREKLAALIREYADVQIAWCYPEEIDRWNILHAAMIAMRRALGGFQGRAQTVLVDGHLSPFEARFRCSAGLAPRLGFKHVETLVKGDQRSLSIAAASIVAKVYRDAWMTELASIFPGYAFEAHKGYSTPVHYEAIRRLGACAIHRKSFAPFKNGAIGPGDCNAGGDGNENESLELAFDS